VVGIASLERGILERLEERVPGLSVEAYPDKPDSYRLRHQVGALLVAYRGARYSAPQDVWDAVQERELSFDVHVVVRSLSGHRGAYEHLEAVRVALSGHRVEGFTPLAARGEAFLGYGEGVWAFAVSVAAVMVVATAPA
jgi:hypothetical protein